MASANSSHQPESSTRLRHRSRASDSENVNGNSPPGQSSSSDFMTNDGKGSEGSKPVSSTDDSEKSSHIGQEGKSLLGYFMTELTKHYRLEADASEFVERRDRVYTSVYTPKNLEKFLAFGLLQCLDSILYMVTFLPLRILVALMRLLTYPCTRIFVGRRPILDASQVCDLLKGLILVVSCYITSQVDMSMIYHIVRGQSIMKFYVFFNMLDVMDKLVSQFGQDILDSLYWTAVEPRGRKREHFGTFFHLVFATVYVVAHTMMILMQAIILNVAFNSHNKNLLTVMMSNNFVEIKVNVFKRVDKTNLCQITYSDVRERFHYMVLLFFVFVRNMKELQWNWDMALPLLQDAAIVFIVEVFVDWIKHAFITKLSELSASHYGEFSLGLAQDIASSQKKHAFTNFSDQVCRRMGFTPMPLICLLYMVTYSSFTVEGPLAWLLVFILYICLVSTKVLNSIILLGWAQRLIDERDKSAQSRGTVVNSQTHPKKEAGKKPGPAKSDPPVTVSTARMTESDTSLYTPPLITDPLLSQSNDTWSSSFSAPTPYLDAGVPVVPRFGNGQAPLDAMSSSSLFPQPSPSYSIEHQPVSALYLSRQDDEEMRTNNGLFENPLCVDQPPAYILGSGIHGSNGAHTSEVGSATIFSSVSHPMTENLGVLSTGNQMNVAVESSPSLPNLTSNPAPTLNMATNACHVSHSHPTMSPPVSSSLPSQLDRAQSLPTPSKTSDLDNQTEAPVRSPKRKHSATSINSADSFFMENPESGPTLASDNASAAASDSSVRGRDCHEEMIPTSQSSASRKIENEETLKLSLTQPLHDSNIMDVSSVHTSKMAGRGDSGHLILPNSAGAQLIHSESSKDIPVAGDEDSAIRAEL